MGIFKRSKSKIVKFWKTFGPGLITGASDDDPSGIATYSQAGAKFGYSLLWTAVVTTTHYLYTEMCIARVCHRQRANELALKKYYPKWVVYLILFVCFLHYI